MNQDESLCYILTSKKGRFNTALVNNVKVKSIFHTVFSELRRRNPSPMASRQSWWLKASLMSKFEYFNFWLEGFSG